MITDQSSDLRAGVPAHQPEPGESITRSCRSEGYLPPLRPHPIVSLLSTPISILITSFVLFTSCTSPTPPPPPPPPPASPDTASHEFIWQIDTLGDGNSSVLYDVAIINDTTIWAVGEIYLKDSTGQVDPDAYGLAKWNGTRWSFSRLGALAPQGYVSNLLPRAIFAIAPNEIWFAAGGAHRLKNNVLTPFWINDFPGNPSPIWTSGQLSTRIWASTSSDVYVVGTAGAIAHFDGTVWRRIESGTTVGLVDVAGTGPRNAWTAGYDLTTGQASVLLRLVDGLVEKRYEYTPPYPGERPDSLTGIVTAIWTDSEERVFALDGGNVWILPDDTRGNGSTLWWRTEEGGFLTGLRGTSANNIFVAGHFGEVGHFNGSTWRWYKQFFNFSSGPFLRAIVCRGDLVVAVGGSSGRAIAIRGRR